MAQTSNFQSVQLSGRGGFLIQQVDGVDAPAHLKNLRIPPAWTKVTVDPDPAALVIAIGYDKAGRKQRLYSAEHIATAKTDKFERVRALLDEFEDIRTEIEETLNDKSVQGATREAALVSYLIYETGMRPGSVASAEGENSQEGTATFGATTLQLRHVKPCSRGVRLKFIGKKGVSQNVLVTNPYLAREFKRRKQANPRWSSPLFEVSASKVNSFIGSLGSGAYSAKDFRTARGTKLALELLGTRKTLPKAKSRVRKILNTALDKVAKILGNTRAVSKNSYVDPAILERFMLKLKPNVKPSERLKSVTVTKEES